MSKQSRIHSLDILRSIAIIVVFLFHFQMSHGKSIFGITGKMGWAGVDLFFVLSGYLIGNQVFSEIVRTRKISVLGFYIKRLFRTLPVYFLVLAIYFLFPIFRERPELPSLWKFFTFTVNFGLVGGAFSHAWSLCIEEQFYVGFPLAVLMLNTKSNKNLGWAIGAFLVIGGMFLRNAIWLSEIAHTDAKGDAYFSMIYYPTWARLDGLVMGVGAAALKNFHRQTWARLLRMGNFLFACGSAILIFALHLFSTDRYGQEATAFGYPLLALGFSLWLISALGEKTWFYRLKIPGAKNIALLSYSIYLIHKPVIHMTHLILGLYGRGDQVWLLAILSAFASVLAASVLYLLVEKPFLKMRDHFTAKPSLFPILQSHFTADDGQTGRRMDDRLI